MADVSHRDESSCTRVYFLVTKAHTYPLAPGDSEKRNISEKGGKEVPFIPFQKSHKWGRD